MCIWKVNEDERLCEYCSYYGGCEVRERVIPVFERGNMYVSVLNEIVCGDILEHCRDRLLVCSRNMVFYQLVKDGYSLHTVGRFMGFNHSTVFHGKKQVENMLDFPGMYKEEYRIWLKFQKIIGEC